MWPFSNHLWYNLAINKKLYYFQITTGQRFDRFSSNFPIQRGKTLSQLDPTKYDFLNFPFTQQQNSNIENFQRGTRTDPLCRLLFVHLSPPEIVKPDEGRFITRVAKQWRYLFHSRQTVCRFWPIGIQHTSDRSRSVKWVSDGARKGVTIARNIPDNLSERVANK